MAELGSKLMKEVQLHGGPAHGKRMAIDDGMTRLVLPTLNCSEPFGRDDGLTLEIDAATGWPSPPKLPLGRAIYLETEPGRFEYQETTA